MHKIDHPTAAPGGLFTIGDPVGGVAATVVTDDWLNAVQGEIANVIEGAGLPLSKPDNSQLLAAIDARILAFGQSWLTGDVILTMRAAAADGWIVCNDGTIGSGASAATTRANDDCEDLYMLLWNGVADAYAPVSSGRGVSAAADWAAGKTIGLTKMLGRALAIAGGGAGLTSRPIGQAVGTETHVLAESEMPAHNHGVTDPGHSHSASFRLGQSAGGLTWAYGGTVDNASQGVNVVANTTGITIQNKGGGGAHNNMQPTTFLYAHIKL